MAEAALTLVARDNLAHGDLASQLALAVSVVAYATLGALIVRRAGNLIGWIMLAAGAAQGFLTIASIYAVIGIATFPGSLPAAKQVGTLGLLEESADDPAAVTELVAVVKNGVRAALDDLRDLARGIYPPLLADQGLVPALQAQAGKASLQVEIDTDGIGRYPQDTEAAVYFCTLEALQNIAKYASASRAKVGLSCSDDSLRFTVTDNGTGFDTATTGMAPARREWPTG